MKENPMLTDNFIRVLEYGEKSPCYINGTKIIMIEPHTVKKAGKITPYHEIELTKIHLNTGQIIICKEKSINIFNRWVQFEVKVKQG